MVTLALIAIIQEDIETSGHRDNKLMQCLMSMPSTLRATWDIIQIINPLDLERDVPSALNERKVAARITNLRDIYEPTLLDAHLPPYCPNLNS